MQPEVCTDDIPPPIIRRPDVELYRKKGIRVYSVLFVLQLIVGLGSVACSVAATRLGAARLGVPYFTGGFVIAGLMLFSSLLAFRIYNKGPAFSIDDVAKKEVKCALNCHHTCSFLLFFGTVVGLAIIWMYGLCIGDDDVVCSYGDDHVTENRVLAGINLALGVCALATSGIGVCLIRKYGSAFDVDRRPRTGREGRDSRDHVLRRTTRMQNVFTLPEPTGVSDAYLGTDGYTNYGFEPPFVLPSYYTTTSAHAHDSHVTPGVPAEPPPPYSEYDPKSASNEINTHL